MNVQTYLYFDGCCEEAIEHYIDVFGAEKVFAMRFKDGPKEMIPPGGEEKIFHATLKFGRTLINLSDAPPQEQVAFQGFAMLIHFDAAEDTEKAFHALQVGGEVRVALCATPWAPLYGIIRDRFGITWKLQFNGLQPL